MKIEKINVAYDAKGLWNISEKFYMNMDTGGCMEQIARSIGLIR